MGVRLKNRVRFHVTLPTDIAAAVDTVADTLQWDRTVVIEFACLHYLEYLASARNRPSTMGIVARRLAQRGLAIKRTHQRGKARQKLHATYIVRRKQDTNQDNSTQIQDTNTVTSNDAGNGNLGNPDGVASAHDDLVEHRSDVSLRKDALSQSDP